MADTKALNAVELRGQADVEVVGDLAHTLWMLNERCWRGSTEDSHWDHSHTRAARAAMLADFASFADDDAEGTIKPQKALWDARQALGPDDVLPWLHSFLPGLPTAPRAMLEPAEVSDPTDGQIAHLHGLNISRAWGWMVLAEALPSNDPRRAPLIASAERHAAASMPFVTGSDYAVEHWLAVYAMLLLTFDDFAEQSDSGRLG